MSGIAGIIRFDGAPVEAGQIAKLTNAMASRGPDGIRHWIAGSVALGHCMLRTTPESIDEIQPLTNENESLVLVMDGRLDNRKELRQELQSRGMRARCVTDADFVLRAYRLWGGESPRYLLGDFAFAIWDVHRQELFCARDHCGVKPFYYFSSERFMAFASDEEALLNLPDVSLEPNEDRIASLFVPELRGYDFNASWLKGVFKLPPGNTVLVEGTGKAERRTYWRLEPSEESRFGCDFECEEAFRSVFGEAVRRRMRAIGNPGLMLSGGIDSASIAGAAHSLSKSTITGGLDIFSAVSDGVTTCTETRNIQRVVNECRTNANLVVVPRLNGIISLDDLKAAAWTYSHPVANSMLLPAMMYLAAARSGNRVMFDGINGDLVAYVPTWYPASLIRSGAWREAWAECRQASVNNTYLRDRSSFAILYNSVRDLFVPSVLRALKQATRDLVGPAYKSSLINPDFAKKICLVDKLKTWRAERGPYPVDHQRRHIHALSPIGIAIGMEGFDRVAARYGIEPRHPWSDKSLIEFYVRLPLRQKVRAGWTKYLVRKASAPWLEKDVRWYKEKDHLGRLFVRVLLHQSHEDILETLGRAEETIGEYLNMDRLTRLLGQLRKSPEDSALAELYHAMTLSLWLKRVKVAR